MSLVDTDRISAFDFPGGYALPNALSHVIYDGRDLFFAEASGMQVFELGANGALVTLSTQLTPTTDPEAFVVGSIGFGASGHFVQYDAGGQTYLYYAGYIAKATDSLLTTRSITLFSVGADGALTVEARYQELENFATGFEVVSIKGNDFLAQLGGYGDRFALYEIGSDARLTETARIDALPGSGFPPYDTVTLGKFGFAVYGYDVDEPLSFVKFDGRGRIRETGSVSETDPGLRNHIINDIEIIQFGKRAVVVVVDNTSGLLTSYELDRFGNMTVLDINVPVARYRDRSDPGDFWQFATVVKAFEMDGQHYVAVGAGSLAIFAVTSEGHLVEVEEFGTATTRFNIKGLDVVVRDDGAYIVASTHNAEQGVRAFRFRPEDDHQILGEAADELIEGTAVEDWIVARGGRDTINAGDGDDAVNGGRGRDRIDGGDGSDNLFGGSSGDVIRGGDGNDFIDGGTISDRLFGDEGNDRIYGHTGEDTIFGGGGSDHLYGERGRDQIFGDLGNDFLYDGTGSDTLTGGGNVDTFVFTKDGELDVILDWEAIDKIDLRDYGDDLIFAAITFAEIDANTVELTIEGDVLRIVSASEIDENSFGLSDFLLA